LSIPICTCSTALNSEGNGKESEFVVWPHKQATFPVSPTGHSKILSYFGSKYSNHVRNMSRVGSETSVEKKTTMNRTFSGEKKLCIDTSTSVQHIHSSGIMNDLH
jgi:hypothetical protein